jgi:glutathione synthase/RimK-type ligase-like ATP-grasp enzyme
MRLKMKLRLVSKQLKSGSLKRLSQSLKTRVGYYVYRSDKPKLNRKNILYGAPVNKLNQYKYFEANNIPALPYTTDKTICKSWLAEGKTVVARTLLNSCEGKGIVIIEPGDTTIPEAPVYTQYLKKKKEFRVHIYKDTVVCVLEKRKKIGVSSDSKIRNTKNGYVFCRSGVEEPNGLRDLALAAAKVTPSFFKGVDIGYNQIKDKLFIIEVNSAPGFEGSTVEQYANAILADVSN